MSLTFIVLEALFRRQQGIVAVANEGRYRKRIILEDILEITFMTSFSVTERYPLFYEKYKADDKYVEKYNYSSRRSSKPLYHSECGSTQ